MYTATMDEIDLEFCEKCQNLMSLQVLDDELFFKCGECNSIYPAVAESTLRYQEEKHEGLALFATLLKTLPQDRTNLKAAKKCVVPKCRGEFVRQARLGENMQLINGCITCGHRWFE